MRKKRRISALSAHKVQRTFAGQVLHSHMIPARRKAPRDRLSRAEKRVHYANSTIEPIMLKVFCQNLVEPVVLGYAHMCASNQFSWYAAYPRIALRRMASFG